MRYGSALALAGLVLFSACGGGAPVPHEVVGVTSEPLRSAFDADSGKVRALFLASPT